MRRARPGWTPSGPAGGITPGLRATHESFVFRDPPDHTRLRRPVSGEFSPSKVRRLHGYIAEVTDHVLDLVAEAGGEPLEGLRLAADGSTRADLPVIDRAGEALISYFAGLVAERRKTPRHDIVSALAAVRDSGDGGAGGPDDRVLTPDEMLQSLTLIFSAAIESMADLLLNGTAALIEFPAQAAALRADPTLTAGAVEETLRYDAPVQGIGRIPASDLNISGVVIPAGTFVLPLLGAGNRDPDRFPDPDTFDITRSGPAPLSLSGGVHFCLGAVLARLEAAVFFPALTGRFPELALAAQPVRRGFALRGFASSPVVLR